MIQHFQGLVDEPSIKQRYKELAKEYHPDLGGCLETMKVINAQYEQVLKGTYQKAGKSITEIDELLAKDEALRNQIYKIIHLEGLIIELCGSWLWVNGDTKRHKECLKEANFRWSNHKKSWYWRSEAKKGWFKHGNEYDMFAIRERHGSIPIAKREYHLIS